MARPRFFGAVPAHLLPEPLAQLSRSALLLYLHLACFGGRWAHVEAFECTDPVVSYATGLRPRTINDARRELARAQLLVYRAGQGQAGTLYELHDPVPDPVGNPCKAWSRAAGHRRSDQRATAGQTSGQPLLPF